MKPLNHPPSFSLNTSKGSFSKTELESCADGLLFGPGNAQLPSGPLLMMDRVIDIRSSGGQYDKGYAVSELDITPDSWFFQHHFTEDPIMPGCFLIESMWQLTGFYLAWCGLNGKGRVLDSGKTRFLNPVTAEQVTLTTTIHVRKLLIRDNPICITDSKITINGESVCHGKGIKIGLFI